MDLHPKKQPIPFDGPQYWFKNIPPNRCLITDDQHLRTGGYFREFPLQLVDHHGIAIRFDATSPTIQGVRVEEQLFSAGGAVTPQNGDAFEGETEDCVGFAQLVLAGMFTAMDAVKYGLRPTGVDKRTQVLSIKPIGAQGAACRLNVRCQLLTATRISHLPGACE